MLFETFMADALMIANGEEEKTSGILHFSRSMKKKLQLLVKKIPTLPEVEVPDDSYSVYFHGIINEVAYSLSILSSNLSEIPLIK